MDPAELQAAIAAAANNQQTAEQAALMNAAYRNNQMPVTPQYSLWGAPQYADYSGLTQAQRAQYAQLQGSNLTTVNVNGAPTYLTPQEYQARFGMTPAQSEAQKYAVFNNPASVNPATLPPNLQATYAQQMRQATQEYYRANPSPAYQAITNQYGFQHNANVSTSGTMYPFEGGYYNYRKGEVFRPTVFEPPRSIYGDLAWDGGKGFENYFTPQQIADINAGLGTSRQAADQLFTSPVQSSPVSSPPTNPGLNAGALFAIPGMMAITQGTTMAEVGIRGFFTGLTTSADLIAPSLAPVSHFTFGVAEAFPETFMAGAYLIPAGVAILTQPAAFASAVLPGVSQSVSQMIAQAGEDPFRFTGNVVGMIAFGHVMGKITNAGAPYLSEKISEISPVNLRVGTPLRAGVEGEFNYVTTLETRNPFSTNPGTPRAYSITGVDVEGVKLGFGSPTGAMKELTITADPVFNVRDMTGAHVMSEPQRVILDPFFREVSAGTANEPLVNAVFDMKENIGANVRGGSETTLKYTNAQPAGTLRQIGIDPAVQFEVHEILADAGATRLGSAAETDWLGSRFMRDTVFSDIDVDIPKANYASAIEDLKTAYSQNIEPVRLPETGSRFSLMKNPASETIISPGIAEKFVDVRSLDVTTASGKLIGQQTPEYGIESKASRSLGGRILQYDPQNGIEVMIHEAKFDIDIADIYAASRGVARTAYEQNQFAMGRTYEGIADNLNAYAKSRGMDTLIRTIPEDILATPEAVRAKTIAGIKSGAYKTNIFGVDLPDFGTTNYEYPTARYVEATGPANYGYPITIFSGFDPTSRSISAATIIRPDNYPETSRSAQSNPVMTGYPVSYSAFENTPLRYPAAAGNTIIPEYPIAEKTAASSYRFASPVTQDYPTTITQNYPPTPPPPHTLGYNPPSPPPYTPGLTPPPHPPGLTPPPLPPIIPPYIPPPPPTTLISHDTPFEWHKSKRRRLPARFLELFSFEMGTVSPVPRRFGLGGVNPRATGQHPARFMELFSLEQGTTTPVPERFGKGGVNTFAQRGNPEARFIPGYRGYAGNILNPDDIAPQGLFDIAGPGVKNAPRRRVTSYDRMLDTNLITRGDRL